MMRSIYMYSVISSPAHVVSIGVGGSFALGIVQVASSLSHIHVLGAVP